MAPSLPELPAELLLKIIESEVEPEKHPDLDFVSFKPSEMQKRMYIALRSTCREINAKVVYFFGSKYFKNVRVQLNEVGMEKLQAISHSPFRAHVCGLNIFVSTLFHQILLDGESDTTDASQCSWYGESAMGDMDIENCKCSFNESLAEFISDGSCGRMLGQALTEFNNLSSFSFRHPMVYSEGIVAEKAETL
jgi:hypothetical protein